ncbi:putative transferase [Cinnamomum micranthum f. kanehirae]|uniref:Putative transferase n=1 Tax=Cinnamomum micranthum f. kanehirae TaxID=337451 RepID=A0A3S3N3Z2_9MAGN|nr:putative transferase [Cinnamomum micranthum f. kanehirae]
MKANQIDAEKLLWDQMPTNVATNRLPLACPKLLVSIVLFLSLSYFFYTLKILSSSHPCSPEDPPLHISTFVSNISLPKKPPHQSWKRPSYSYSSPQALSAATELRQVVFGIAASASLWEKRKEYIKLWWRPKEMRGVVWLDKAVRVRRDEGLPAVKISADTSRFSYTNKKGHRSAIRISRIVSETLRLGLKDVRWFVMGDDDTVFVVENLVRVLSKYDHRQFYYIGSLSESHLQNIYFSYGMAYGGGGFAISYPLAVALAGMQDRSKTGNGPLLRFRSAPRLQSLCNLVEMDLFIPVLPSSPVEPCYGDDGILLRGWWRSSRFVCEWALPSMHCKWREGDREDDGGAGLEMPVSVKGMRWRKEMETGREMEIA